MSGPTRTVLIRTAGRRVSDLADLGSVHADVIVLCGDGPGPSEGVVAAFADSPDDAWTQWAPWPTERDPLRWTDPLSPYRAPAEQVDGSVTWRLHPGATLLRRASIERLGGVDDRFTSIAGALRELGWRWMRLGGVCRQRLALVPVEPGDVPLGDEHLLVWLHGGRVSRVVTGGGELLARGRRVATVRAIREARARASLPHGSAPAGDRLLELRPLEGTPRVSVVLPTRGRDQHVVEILRDIAAQSVAPTQVIIADGNERPPGSADVYAAFGSLPLEVVPVPAGISVPRNAALARVTGEFVWFLDDDSRVAADNLEAHLALLETLGADVSVGPAVTAARPELHGFQRHVGVTFMDCGTTLCRTSILERAGAFDETLDQCFAGEDNELGIRIVRAGGLMLNNPFAERFHHAAPMGGARVSALNTHRFRRLSLTPRPNPAWYYIGARHFDRLSATIGLALHWALAGRRAGVERSVVVTGVIELLLLPISLLRLARAIRAGREMIAGGPIVPEVSRDRGEAPPAPDPAPRTAP